MVGYWSRMAKLILYMASNLKSLKKAKESGNTKRFEKLFMKSCELYADAIFKSAKIDFEVIGQDKVNADDTYLIVANHSGMVDIASVTRAFPKCTCFVSKIELSNVIVFSEWMRTMGSIFIDRNDSRASIVEMNKAIESLKNGMSMCVFPEGTRNNTGQIEEFKKGSFKLAFKSGVKILPMVLWGTRSVYEDNNNKLRDGSIKVKILDPIDVSILTSYDMKNLHNIVRDKMNEVYKNFK